MIIPKERKEFYRELEIDLGRLKLYYINRAKVLLECLTKCNDEYSIELKEALKTFIENPNKDLKDVIDDVKTQRTIDYNSFGINNTIFDIHYADNDLINFYLEEEAKEV